VNSEQNALTAESRPKPRNNWWFWISAIAALLFGGSEFVEFWIGGSRQFWAVLPIFLAVPVALWLTRTGRQVAASIAFVAAIGLQAILTPLVQSGLGLPNSITALALIGGICLTTLPNKYVGRVLTAGLIVSFASILIDLFGSPNRPVAELSQGRWIFALAMLAIFVIFFAREFPSLNLRAKIVIGIIGTGAIALAILVIFSLYQSRQITSTLAQRLDTSVRQLAEEQLSNSASTQQSTALSCLPGCLLPGPLVLY